MTLLIAEITGIYAPKISSIVEPETPGKNIAETAKAPIKNSLTEANALNLSRFSTAEGALPLTTPIMITSSMPATRNKIPPGPFLK